MTAEQVETKVGTGLILHLTSYISHHTSYIRHQTSYLSIRPSSAHSSSLSGVGIRCKIRHKKIAPEGLERFGKCRTEDWSPFHNYWSHDWWLCLKSDINSLKGVHAEGVSSSRSASISSALTSSTVHGSPKSCPENWQSSTSITIWSFFIIAYNWCCKDTKVLWIFQIIHEKSFFKVCTGTRQGSRITTD